MTEDTRIRDTLRQHLHTDVLPAHHEAAASVETVITQRGDRYTQHLLNRITQSLNVMLRHRTASVGDVVLRSGQGIPQEGHEGRQAELSLFEKVFLAHFEGGASLGANLPPDVSKFLLKSSEDWTAFFQKFLPFTSQKTGNLSDLKSIIFRGLLQEAAKPALLISDLQFLNGKMDKFARLKIQSTEMMSQLADTMPGDALAMALVAKLLKTPEFSYLSLSHRVVNPDSLEQTSSSIARAYQSPEKMKETLLREGVRNVSQGIALSARTEQLMAEKLDFPIRPVSVHTPVEGNFLKKKKAGLWGRLWGDEGVSSNSVFVPWYQHVFSMKKQNGKPRWWVPFIYFIACSAIGLTLYSFVRMLVEK